MFQLFTLFTLIPLFQPLLSDCTTYNFVVTGDGLIDAYTEWLISSDYVLADGVEVAVAHWYPIGTEEKYIEIWLPVEKK